jgi:hypothetical protein
MVLQSKGKEEAAAKKAFEFRAQNEELVGTVQELYAIFSRLLGRLCTKTRLLKNGCELVGE